MCNSSCYVAIRLILALSFVVVVIIYTEITIIYIKYRQIKEISKRIFGRYAINLTRRYMSLNRKEKKTFINSPKAHNFL